jgi:hypothetical protein
MSFKDLLQELHHSYPQPNPRYYHIILENASVVLLESAKRSQALVARDLGMSYQRFNNIFPLIKEYAQ